MKIGTIEVGKRPEIVLVLTTELNNMDKLKENLSFAKSLKVNFVEFRVDYLENISKLSEILDILGDYNFYIIGTIRPKFEGGLFPFDENRLILFEQILEHPSTYLVDIEFRSKIVKEVIELAKKIKKFSIVSYHDFEKTPSAQEILKIYDEIYNLNPSFVKLSFKANSFEDVKLGKNLLRKIADDYRKIRNTLRSLA
ncbi:MAG TPA: type I 3-dehydroquinate dehydratase [Aquificae bacterium]|nr:type I 3-dehydroquinate dehydratase [Aquificota bacterium]